MTLIMTQQQQQQQQFVYRYIPPNEEISLQSDAPGYLHYNCNNVNTDAVAVAVVAAAVLVNDPNSNHYNVGNNDDLVNCSGTTNAAMAMGPICWKCYGTGISNKKKKKKKKKTDNYKKKSSSTTNNDNNATITPMILNRKNPSNPTTTTTIDTTTVTTTTNDNDNNCRGGRGGDGCTVCDGSGRMISSIHHYPLQQLQQQQQQKVEEDSMTIFLSMGLITRGRRRRSSSSSHCATTNLQDDLFTTYDDNDYDNHNYGIDPVGYSVPYYGPLVQYQATQLCQEIRFYYHCTTNNHNRNHTNVHTGGCTIVRMEIGNPINKSNNNNRSNNNNNNNNTSKSHCPTTTNTNDDCGNNHSLGNGDTDTTVPSSSIEMTSASAQGTKSNMVQVITITGNDEISYNNNNNTGDSCTQRQEQLPTIQPAWLPIQTTDMGNEQLCNLVGQWRILQKYKSHRYTTDDVVTAVMACRDCFGLVGSRSSCNNSNHDQRQQQQQQQSIHDDNQKKKQLSYCDLGTGNGSVLQMILWKVLSSNTTTTKTTTANNNNNNNIPFHRVLGLEARKEAVQLLLRSLSFNIGTPTNINNNNNNNNNSNNNITSPTNDITDRVMIVRTDFRSYCKDHVELHNQFDVVTGTPPYFQVDFHIPTSVSSSNDDDDTETPTETPRSTGTSSRIDNNITATIRQGGMPLSIQSAPARCEFRGGIEEYCVAALYLLKPGTGLLCICENYMNHQRAMQAFTTNRMILMKYYIIEGKVGRGPLFCVYIVRKIGEEDVVADRPSSPGVVRLAVRDEKGEWTHEYQRMVLDYMSIIY